MVRRAIYCPPAFLALIEAAPVELDQLLLELHPDARREVVTTRERWAELEQLGERLAWEDTFTWEDVGGPAPVTEVQLGVLPAGARHDELVLGGEDA